MTPADRKALAADYMAREKAGGGLGVCDPEAIILELAEARGMTPTDVAKALLETWEGRAI